MIRIGLLKEGKIPPDNRVALTPAQCRWLLKNKKEIQVFAQSSPHRCFTDKEYIAAGVEVCNSLEHCDILLGIKEVPAAEILSNKTYLFFSHTCKKQPHNQKMLQTILQKKATLIDYECLRHDDGQRIIGFGFFAGIVGAHNGIMAYGYKTKTFELGRVYEQKDFRNLIRTYFGLKLPNIKIAVTGSGRVAQGIVEIMNLMGVIEVEKEEFRERDFQYPVYVHLKGSDLYRNKLTGSYQRDEFHNEPQKYECLFRDYLSATDILMNGIYWDSGIPRLFDKEDVSKPEFRISVIADITDDCNGSVPINYGDQSIADPVYGVDRFSLEKTTPYQDETIDVMAVGNLPNELPRDASRYFGEQLLKYVLQELMWDQSKLIEKATIVKNGQLTPAYAYLHDYAHGEID